MRGASFLLFLLLPSCAIHVTPPPSPADPTTVYVVDHGDTARLLLPREDDPEAPFVEYAYGDWKWYARDQGNPLYGMIVFFVPTQGTLARREYASDPHDSLWGEHILPIDVERTRAEALVRSLDERFQSEIDTLHVNESRGLDFVKDDRGYWVFNQSSTTIARWLRELGCKTSGFAIKANFKLRGTGTKASRHEGIEGKPAIDE